MRVELTKQPGHILQSPQIQASTHKRGDIELNYNSQC